MLEVQHDGPVTRITLNRAEVRNAFNDELVELITGAARTVSQRKATRVVILQGAGSVFCAGADLRWMSRMVAYSHEQNSLDASRLAIMFHALNTMPQPVLARVHGAALGGGAGLAAVADIVVADESAVFGFTEVKLGILPAVISPYVLAKIGPSAARELFLTGTRFSALRAREIGLVHYVLSADAIDGKIEELARELLSSGPAAMALSKELIRRVICEMPDDVIGLTSETIAKQRVSAEGQEGMRAFLEKRAPEWAPKESFSPPKASQP